MDPSGNFVYLVFGGGGNSIGELATYRIHRSSGALTWTGWARTVGTLSGTCAGSAVVTTDFTGQHVYLNAGTSCSTAEKTYGFNADPNHGFLTAQVPGSPLSFPNGFPAGASMGKYLYVNDALPFPSNSEMLGFSVTPGSGALTALSGSPFPLGLPSLHLSADWKTRFLWAWDANELQTLTINPTTGDLTASGLLQLPPSSLSNLVENHTGQFAFTSRADVPEVDSWVIDPNGILTPLNSVTLSTSSGFVGSVAVARKNPI
jgi:hypothetical protein